MADEDSLPVADGNSRRDTQTIPTGTEEKMLACDFIQGLLEPEYSIGSFGLDQYSMINQKYERTTTSLSRTVWDDLLPFLNTEDNHFLWDNTFNNNLELQGPLRLDNIPLTSDPISDLLSFEPDSLATLDCFQSDAQIASALSSLQSPLPSISLQENTLTQHDPSTKHVQASINHQAGSSNVSSFDTCISGINHVVATINPTALRSQSILNAPQVIQDEKTATLDATADDIGITENSPIMTKGIGEIPIQPTTSQPRLPPQVVDASTTHNNYNLPPKTSNVVIDLCRMELWQRFRTEGTEMITSTKGRQMFPQLKVKITGLEPQKLYAVWLHFATDDREDQCWKWNSSTGKWELREKSAKQMAVPALSGTNVEVYNHPWVTASGKKLMEDPISFDKLRLTNDPKNKTHVLLVPFRKYIPTVYVAPVAVGGGNGEMRMDGDVNFFRIEMAEFISSSAYHNPRMAALKIETNPMAKSQRNLRKNQKLQQQRSQHQIGGGAAQVDTIVQNPGLGPISQGDAQLQQNQFARRSASSLTGAPAAYTERHARLHRSNSTPNSALDLGQRHRFRSKSPSTLSRPRSPSYHFQAADAQVFTPQATPPISSMGPTPLYSPAQAQKYSFSPSSLDPSKDANYIQRLSCITDESTPQAAPVTPMKRGDTSTYTKYATGRRSNHASLTPSNLGLNYSEESDMLPLRIFQS